MTIEEKFIESLEDDKFKFIKPLLEILHLQDRDFLRHVVESYKDYPHGWFAEWHKSFRQIDVFHRVYAEPEYGDLTREENVRRIELQRLRIKYRQDEINMTETPEGWRNYNLWGKELEILNKKSYYGDNSKVSVGIHLDILMHRAIHENIDLYDHMDKFLKEWK